MAVSLEIQAQEIKGDVLRQAKTAKAEVRREATKAEREHLGSRAVEIPGKPTPALGIDERARIKREIEEWEREQLKVVSEAERKGLVDVERQLVVAKERGAITFTPGEAPEEYAERVRIAAQEEFDRLLQIGEIPKGSTFLGAKNGQLEYLPPVPPLTMADARKDLEGLIAEDPSLAGARVTKLTRESYEYSIPAPPLTDAQGRKEFASWVAKGEAPDGTLISKDAVYKGVEDGHISYETPGVQVYEIDTPSGPIEIPVSEWKAKNIYEQLKIKLGRAPSGPEVTSYARLLEGGIPPETMMKEIELPGGPLGTIAKWTGIEWIYRQVVGRPMTALEASLGESPYGEWFEETTPAAREAYDIFFAEMKGKPKPTDPLARALWEHEQAWFSAWTTGAPPYMGGLPAIRALYPGVERKDITFSEYLQTFVTGAILAAPVAGTAISQVRLATIGLKGPVITKKPLVTGGLAFKFPVGFQKLRIGTLPGGKYFWVPRPTLKMPLGWTRPSIHMPVSVRWGSGLERAGFPQATAQAALEAGSASRALAAATRAAKGVEITSPRYLKLQSNLLQAGYRSATADRAYFRTLTELKVTPRQIKLLEKATGYTGLKAPLGELQTSATAVQKAWTRVESYKPGTRGHILALEKLARAQERLGVATSAVETKFSLRWMEAPSPEPYIPRGLADRGFIVPGMPGYPGLPTRPVSYLVSGVEAPALTPIPDYITRAFPFGPAGVGTPWRPLVQPAPYFPTGAPIIHLGAARPTILPISAEAFGLPKYLAGYDFPWVAPILAPGYAETLVAAPERDLTPAERHALGTMTAAQRARLAGEEVGVTWAVGQPLPGLAPISKLSPTARLAFITRLSLTTGLVPAMRLAPITRLVPLTRLAPITSLAPMAQVQPLTQLRVVTSVTPVTRVVTTPTVRISVKAARKLGRFPFFWWPEARETKEKRKKLLEERILAGVEPYPGIFPELMLYMPTPLEEVIEPLRPRPVIKKRKYRIRKKGTYPVAGYKRIRA